MHGRFRWRPRVMAAARLRRRRRRCDCERWRELCRRQTERLLGTRHLLADAELVLTALGRSVSVANLLSSWAVGRDINPALQRALLAHLDRSLRAANTLVFEAQTTVTRARGRQ